MEQRKVIRIFLASPGDVQTERTFARQVIDALSRTIGRDRQIHLEALGWDTDARPAYGGDAQQLLNNQIADMQAYELFVGIMWNRFGQETPRAGSGTEEEFDRAVESFEQHGRPQIMFYFSQAPANLSSQEALEQKRRVLQFKEKVRGGGMTWDYASPEQFRGLFQEHLSSWLLGHTRGLPDPPTQPARSLVEQPGQAATVLPPTHADWIYLDDTFCPVQSVEEDTAGIIKVRIAADNAEDEARLRALRPGERSRVAPIGYAYQNQAALVTVTDCNSRSAAGRTEFCLTLQPSPASSSGIFVETSINGVSADEIATMRARLLLLDEPPESRPHIGRGLTSLYLNSFEAPLKVEKGIFPEFWQRFHGDATRFVPLARLLAVYYLKLTNSCEHVLDLRLGPVQGDRLPVHFRGQRHRVYTNVNPAVIEVDGVCHLRS